MAIARQGVGIRWVLGIACDYGWEHLSACAWGAVWLTVRGQEIQGPREVLGDPSWAGSCDRAVAMVFIRLGIDRI